MIYSVYSNLAQIDGLRVLQQLIAILIFFGLFKAKKHLFFTSISLIQLKCQFFLIKKRIFLKLKTNLFLN